jgi:hypothetical protein
MATQAAEKFTMPTDAPKNTPSKQVAESVKVAPVVAAPITSGFDASRLRGGVVVTNRYADSLPANWTISQSEKDPDHITARNSITNNSFEGSRTDFGKYIRGET